MKFEPIVCGDFVVKLAETRSELDDVYRLRYEELLLYYNQNNVNDDGIFIDEYDSLCDHLICYDVVNEQVAGTYRLVLEEHIKDIGCFITESEYDISKLKSKRILELGRAVVRQEYRNGSVIKLLWRGLIKYANLYNIKYMFGTGSFQGVNPDEYAHALSYIYYNHLSPQDVRAYARKNSRELNMVPKEEIDLRKVKQQLPALIKGYIKVGATFGEDVFIDNDFNSVDVFVLLDVDQVNPRILKRFT